jgi:hypothetical protein
MSRTRFIFFPLLAPWLPTSVFLRHCLLRNSALAYFRESWSLTAYPPHESPGLSVEQVFFVVDSPLIQRLLSSSDLFLNIL